MRNIKIIYSSMFIGGFVFFLPVLALYFEKNLFSITNVAIIFAVEAIAFALFEMPTGAVADLFGRKWTLFTAKVLALASLVFLFLGTSMIMFIAFAVLKALGRSLSSGTDSAFIYDTLKEQGKEHDFKKIIGTYYALWPIGASIGSIVGAYLAKISLSLSVSLSFIPMIISTLLILFLKEPKYEKEDHRNLFKHIKNSINIIISKRQLIILMSGGFILMAFGEIIHLLGPIFFEFKQVPIEFFGWITAFIYACSSIGHYFSHDLSVKFGEKKALIFYIICGISLIFLSTLFKGTLAIIAFVLPSIFYGLRNPVTQHLLNLEVASGKRATIISIHSCLGQLGLAIFSPIIGYIAEIYSINIAVRMSAVMMIATPVLYLFLRTKTYSGSGTH